MLPAELTTADAQPASPERRAQIDDFMRLLEAARRAADAGDEFALALLAPAAPRQCSDDDAHAPDRPAAAGGDADDSDRLGSAGDSEEAAKSAHEFLRLNLRRADSLAFYGPTLLVALLPRRRPRRAREEVARLLDEFGDEQPRVRLAFGLAAFPADGADVEALIERADAQLHAALARDAVSEDAHARAVSEDADATAASDGDAKVELASDDAAPESFRLRFQLDGADAQTSATHDASASSSAHDASASTSHDARASATRAPTHAQEFLPLAQPGAQSDSSGEWRTSASSRHAASEGHAASEHSHVRRGLPSDFTARRAVRESRRGDEYEAAVLPYTQSAGGAGSVLGSAAAEAAARERERRASGERMPRRVLLTVSDPALMAQTNLLLRSAAYEVRAAFDGGQALDLLRIERADLLVLDYDLKVLDGPAVLRRLHERHRGRLPLPVVLMLPPERDTEQSREEARGFGASGFVRLPYDPAALLECVRATGEKS